MNKQNIKIDTERKRFIKTGPVKEISFEAMMTRKVNEISRNHKIFRTPEVITFDSERGVLELELIENMAALKSLLSDNDYLSDLLAKAGESLAIIHEELKLDPDDLIRVPDELTCNYGHDGPIHGDFTLRNVQYDMVSRQIIIIDWSFAPRFKTVANYGPQYFDLAFMVNSLFSSPPYSFLSKGEDRAVLARVFIKRYFEVSKARGDLNHFAQYLQLIAQLFFQKARRRTTWRQFLLQRQNRMNFIKFSEDFLR